MPTKRNAIRAQMAEQAAAFRARYASTPEAVARTLGGTAEQAREMFARNAAQLESMADRAALKGAKVNGYTEAELRERAAHARSMATNSKAEGRS